MLKRFTIIIWHKKKKKYLMHLFILIKHHYYVKTIEILNIFLKVLRTFLTI